MFLIVKLATLKKLHCLTRTQRNFQTVTEIDTAFLKGSLAGNTKNLKDTYYF